MKALALLLLATLPLAAQEDEEALHQQLRDTRAEIVAAIESRDPEKILPLIHPEVVVTWQDATVCHGTAELRDFYERMGKDAFVAFKVPHEADKLSVLHGGDTAVATGRVVADYHLLGKAFEFESRWTATLIRQDGRWLVAAYHVSLDSLDNPVLDAAKSAVWIAGGAGILGGIAIATLFGRIRRRAAAQLPA